MDPQQEKYWNVLEFVDAYAVGLDRDDIDFVANLIDTDRHGRLSPGDCLRLRQLLIRHAGGWSAFNAHMDSVIVQRSLAE